MKLNDFVTNYIKNKKDYRISPDEEKTIKFEGVGKYIFNKLNSTKYRAQSTSKDYLEKISDKILLSINHRIPIHLSLPFGATKNPYLPTAPGIDWGEVFNIAYIREYLAPIAKAYKYGVILEYISVAVFEEKVNRISQKDVNFYDREFTNLIKFYQKYLPDNFQLKYTRVSDLINQKEINRLIDLKKDELRKKWNEQSKDVIEQKLFKAKRNCVYDPKDKNVNQILIESALGHDAFCSECWTIDVAPWDKKDMITLGHNYTTGWAIHVRSTPGSSVNFWSGTGVLVERSNKYLPTVLSPMQYRDSSSKISTRRAKIFSKIFSNLTTLPIFEEK